MFKVSYVQVFMIDTLYEYFKWDMFNYIWWGWCLRWNSGKVNLPGTTAGGGIGYIGQGLPPTKANWQHFSEAWFLLSSLLQRLPENRTAYVPSHCHRSECRGSASLHLSLALFTRAKADAWSKRPWTLPRQKDGCISEQRIIPGGWNSCSILQGELPCYPLWKTQKWH